jgi:hypothetical protein
MLDARPSHDRAYWAGRIDKGDHPNRADFRESSSQLHSLLAIEDLGRIEWPDAHEDIPSKFRYGVHCVPSHESIRLNQQTRLPQRLFSEQIICSPPRSTLYRTSNRSRSKHNGGPSRDWIKVKNPDSPVYAAGARGFLIAAEVCRCLPFTAIAGRAAPNFCSPRLPFTRRAVFWESVMP